ncbi:molecular chaperone GrpE (heat shock protein) [Streptomyces sp. PanSC19]|nr:molecular chaperone GrpE (heat shock protein) [Streptomyces sp. PanSC19]
MTFDIDANGILDVSAKDKDTGAQQSITVSGSGTLDESEVQRMIQESERNRAEDTRIRELVEARNELDGFAYHVERRLGELGDSVAVHDKARAESLIADARQAVKEEAPLDRVRSLTGDLQQTLHALASLGGAGEVRPGSEDADGSGAAPVLPELDAEELHDRWQRAVAETENQRKRYERRLEEVRLAERDRVSEAWLPVVDHLELALQHAAADPEAIIAGVEGVCRQAYAVLARLGYQRIAAVGEPFDPALHDAAQVRQEPQAAPGTVVQVLRAGYGSDRGLLRPATVVVQAGPDEREARS